MTTIEHQDAQHGKSGFSRLNNVLGHFSSGLGNRSAPHASARFSMTARLATVVLLVVLFVISARLFWLIFAPLSTPDTPPPVVRAVVSADLEAVKSPFARREEEPVDIGAPVLEAVQETTLNLTLHGVISMGEMGAAIMSMDGAEQKVFMVGGEIADNVTLESVMDNQVTINRSGVLESLKLDKMFADEDAARQTANAPSAATPSRPKRPQVSAQSITDLVRFRTTQNARGDFALALRPNRDNREGFEALGLKEGDILLRVGSTRVTGDPAQANQVIEELMGKKVANIVVERSGTAIPLEIKLAGGTRFSDDSN